MKKVILFFLGICQLVIVAAVDDVQINGAFSTGVNVFHVTNDQEYKQVDLAFNLDFSVPISEEIEGFFQLQGAAGGSYLGFPGPEVVLTDINMSYNPKGKLYSFLFGSFDTPFGQTISRLSNNADMSANMFVKNPLLYATLAGYVGTLNTLGLMTTLDHSLATTAIAITNGTAESASNDDGNFETVVRIKPHFQGLSDMSFSYLFSDDRVNAASFDTVFSGWIIDIDRELTDNVELTAYFARLTYDDLDGSTNNDIESWMLEGRYHFAEFDIALRYDSYKRFDQSAVNSAIPTSFLSYNALSTGQVFDTVESYAFAYKRQLDKHVEFKLETFLELGDFERKTLGSTFYVTFFF